MEFQAQEECTKRVPFWAKIINYLLKETDIMATAEEYKQTAQDIKAIATTLLGVTSGQNSKLDEIRNFIQSLQVGVPITQEKFDEGMAILNEAKTELTAGLTEAQANLAETDQLDEPTP